LQSKDSASGIAHQRAAGDISLGRRHNRPDPMKGGIQTIELLSHGSAFHPGASARDFKHRGTVHSKQLWWKWLPAKDIGKIPLPSGDGSQIDCQGLSFFKMAFPIKVCVVCGEEFELRPGKPGFANRCPACSETQTTESSDKQHLSAEERKAEAEVNAARRRAIRDLLYRKDK
jgi:hypothetical protein